jgi:hypothetical protein
MSHVTTIKVEIKDLDALKEAAKSCGLEFREGQKTYKWYGRHVGDYAVPEGYNVSDLGKCEHAIGVPGNPEAYEIGVCKARDAQGNPTGGYTMLWDFWAGGHGLEAIAGKDCSNVTNEYTKTVAVNEASAFAKANGWSVNQEYNEETNETVIKLRKY